MNGEDLQEREVNTYLRAVRQERNLTCEDVAYSTGISISAIHNYENLESTPSLINAIILADYLGVNVKDVFPVEVLKRDKRYKNKRR